MAKSLSQWWGSSVMECYEDMEILLDISYAQTDIVRQLQRCIADPLSQLKL